MQPWLAARNPWPRPRVLPQTNQGSHKMKKMLVRLAMLSVIRHLTKKRRI